MSCTISIILSLKWYNITHESNKASLNIESAVHSRCPRSNRPNVLFIFADDIRAESVFEIEGDEIDTPNLDRLARYGMTFRNAYTMGSLTAPVCMASRAMMLTGRGLFRQDHRGRNIPESITALPEALSKDDYSTFVSGKWHNDRKSLHRMFESG